MQQPDIEQFSDAAPVRAPTMRPRDCEDVPPRSSGAWIPPSVLVGAMVWIGLLSLLF
jgi:hypothetical protein